MSVMLETILHIAFAGWGFALGFIFKIILDKKTPKRCGASKSKLISQ